jgi:hypothetical protein
MTKKTKKPSNHKDDDRVITLVNEQPKKKLELTFNKKPVEQTEKKPLKLDDLIKLASDGKNVIEKLFSEMGSRIFDEKQLKMISIVDHELQYHILRHLLVLNWVDEFYNKITMKVTLSVDGTRIKSHVEYFGNVKVKMQDSFKQSIDDTLSLTISRDGRGREDAIRFAQSAEDRILRQQMQEQQKNSLWNKFS